MTITDEMVERAAGEIYRDFLGARAGGDLSSHPADAVIAIQCRATARAALSAALEGRDGPQQVSIDISTGDHDHGRRAFGTLTGETNGDVWLAEGYVNEPAPDIARIRAEAVAEERERCARVLDTCEAALNQVNPYDMAEGAAQQILAAHDAIRLYRAAAIRGGA